MLPNIPNMCFCIKNPHTPEKLSDKENSDTIARDHMLIALPSTNQ